MKKTNNSRYNNFGFGKLNKNDEKVINYLRKEICNLMWQHQTLIGFKDDDDAIKTLSIIAVDTCRAYANGLDKTNPVAFNNFVKLVLTDIIDKIKLAA